MNKKQELIQLDIYGVTDNSMTSVVKIENTKYFVSSFFNNERDFIDCMENVIKKQLQA